MGKGSGAGLGLLVLLALFLSKPRKLTSLDFPGAFQPSTYSPTYSQYFDFATMPAEDVEADDALELIEASPISKRNGLVQTGQWLTVNGRIPTPRGTTIPLPTVHVGRTAVETKLQPIEEAIEEPHFQDVAGRRSVNLRLKPL